MEIQRISLASRHGWLAQYLRLGLASISKAYTWLYSWPGILATLLVVILDVLAEVINVPLPAILHGALRFAGMAVVITPVCGALGYYMVREAARRQGLGSLIASGRGIGAAHQTGWTALSAPLLESAAQARLGIDTSPPRYRRRTEPAGAP